MYSRITYILCVILLACSGFSFYPRWKHSGTNAAIAWDVSGYYWYLPSAFIYHDLKHQSFKDSVLEKYQPTGTDFQQAIRTDNGNYVMKYSSGMAYMYLPFFAAAQVIAKPLGFPQDGFSPPYQLAIQLGGFLVSLLGLWYLRKLLRLFYDDRAVAITLLLLVFGTNYLNYAGIDTGMSHAWLFTVYVFLLLNTHYFYTTRKTKYAVRIGLLTGLAALTRPTDIISVLIPLLWGLESISAAALKQKFFFFRQERKKIVIAAICSGAVIFLQLIYWKYASGHWFVYSYGDQKFSWLHPHAFLYNFNYNTGWLTFTPMMLFAIAGFIPFWRHGSNKWAITVFFFVNWYIVCCWDVWQFGGRAMIQSYPVMLFPLTSLVATAFRKNLLKWILYPVAGLFIYLNIWYTYHEHAGALDLNDMSKAYFWKVLGRWEEDPEWLKLKDTNELFEGAPRDKELVYQNNFESDTSFSPLPPIEGQHSLYLDKDHQDVHITFACNRRTSKWMRVQATFHCVTKEWNNWHAAELQVIYQSHGQDVKFNMIRLYPFLDNGDTKDIFIDSKIPQQNFDSVKVQAWNAGGDKPLQIDNLKVWSFS